MKASECKCCVCGAPAVAFWPVIDPDIPSHPYCRKCLDKEKRDLMLMMFGPKKENRKSSQNVTNCDKYKRK